MPQYHIMPVRPLHSGYLLRCGPAARRHAGTVVPTPDLRRCARRRPNRSPRAARRGEARKAAPFAFRRALRPGPATGPFEREGALDLSFRQAHSIFKRARARASRAGALGSARPSRGPGPARGPGTLRRLGVDRPHGWARPKTFGAVPGRVGPGRAGTGWAGPGRAGPGWVGSDRAVSGWSGPGRAGSGWSGSGRAGRWDVIR